MKNNRNRESRKGLLRKNRQNPFMYPELPFPGGSPEFPKLYPDSPLPHITPHVFRHTFCTNYANDGMDIKNLQHLMGHSDAGVTLNVYTHASYAHAAEQMAKISQFRQSPESKKRQGFCCWKTASMEAAD